MNYNRFRFSEEASKNLSFLKARTGLTPNILARIGFCLSINDPMRPDPMEYESNSDREIDRHTLTGPWDIMFVAMIREKCEKDGISQEDALTYFRAHMNRGVLLLFKRIRSLNDIALLLPTELRPSPLENSS